MSYALVVAEVRRGVFEERNLDSIGICALMGKDVSLLVPDDNSYLINEKLVNTIIKVKLEEATFLNPLNMVKVVQAVIDYRGNPDTIVFTHSSSGTELASYVAGYFNLPLITDVSGFNKEKNFFYKSYYSDKLFGEFRQTGEGTCVITVRSGSFKEYAVEKASSPITETIEGTPAAEGRSFIEYVEEETAEIDITKAEFLLSVGRGVGNKDEIPDYEELAGMLKAVLSGSRPVIDKQWLPKPRQVGTSGKTVKPKVYLAMGISGAFQHIAGMKDSDCIIAVNKDPEAPIFQYAHFGIIADIHKVRDKLRNIIKG
ncbi:MAG: electron transfer flavoprotein subunit alpha/FixB family protein [Proteobacteria bacterium]|nr:electron transfer flavoprotein subunit alpha/FixB family protein [Pseudomonadota bacterium]